MKRIACALSILLATSAYGDEHYIAPSGQSMIRTTPDSRYDFSTPVPKEKSKETLSITISPDAKKIVRENRQRRLNAQYQRQQAQQQRQAYLESQPWYQQMQIDRQRATQEYELQIQRAQIAAELQTRQQLADWHRQLAWQVHERRLERDRRLWDFYQLEAIRRQRAFDSLTPQRIDLHLHDESRGGIVVRHGW